MKVRGFQVAPAEIEGHLLQHPDIVDACVVGFPDDYSGEVPLAFVVLSADAAKRAAQSGAEATSIKSAISKVRWFDALVTCAVINLFWVQHVADHKAPYKRLAGGVEFIDAIPKNPSGKLLRRVLRDKALRLKQERSLTRARL